MVQVVDVPIDRVLTRTGGYLRGIVSHSLQPYRGCTFGSSLCGAGCYVRHSPWVTRGRPWGSFLEVRRDAARSYLRHVEAERAWARRKHGSFSVFLSSSTDPFVPQERRFGVTRSVLEAMRVEPPDALVVQTHTDRVLDALDLLRDLAERTRLRVHVSVEGDRERLPGLPPPPASVEARLAALNTLRKAGIFTVCTVAPLHPIADPDRFFARVAQCADACVVDHFVGGDGTPDGSRTRRSPLYAAIRAVEPGALDLGYRDEIVEIARRHLPGRVGVGCEGFAGRFS